jgi:uncharacterized surface protein with fasciclin (FAS1) repeats
MKYIITENQQQRLSKMISSTLESLLVEKSYLICDIKLHVVDPEEDERQIKYDIYVTLNLQELKRFGGAGQQMIKHGIKMKIINHMESWFSLTLNDFFVGFLAKEC